MIAVKNYGIPTLKEMTDIYMKNKAKYDSIALLSNYVMNIEKMKQGCITGFELDSIHNPYLDNDNHEYIFTKSNCNLSDSFKKVIEHDCMYLYCINRLKAQEKQLKINYIGINNLDHVDVYYKLAIHDMYKNLFLYFMFPINKKHCDYDSLAPGVYCNLSDFKSYNHAK